MFLSEHIIQYIRRVFPGITYREAVLVSLACYGAIGALCMAIWSHL